ncbi:MAG: cytochrome b5-like heme/steroid binding domain-containing protein [Candidatus Buchananbacteria bacterium]
MKLVYKIIRTTAWLLVLASVVSLFSGLVMVKSSLFPWFNYQLASRLHSIFSIYIFAPLFYLHSLSGLLLLLARHPKFNKKSIKTIAGIIWTLFLILIIAVYLWPVSRPEKINNTSQIINTNQNTNTLIKIYGVVLNAAEISRHNSANSCWMIIDGKVYDFTNYINLHPARPETILKYCGQDGSVGYETKDKNQPHSAYADSLLKDYFLGNLGQTLTN